MSSLEDVALQYLHDKYMEEGVWFPIVIVKYTFLMKPWEWLCCFRVFHAVNGWA